MKPRPGIPDYELLQPLGGGPLTCVFLARDRASGESCVVKTLREEWTDQSTAIKLIQREARAGLLVRHPNLVRTLYAHVTRPPYFLVLELLPGESARTMLGRVEALLALTIARQIAQALEALHGEGFLHGDVKPDNIRLLRDGTAKLIDLGFAHRPGENVEFLSRGYILGTVNYLAPELCTLEGSADQRSDLFSLGVTLYEMLTGALPYPEGSVGETLRRHVQDQPMEARCHVPSLSEPVLHILDRLLARSPEERMPSATALVQRLLALETTSASWRQSA